jgi:polyhydroxybutyrate depolymerase
MKTLWLSVLLLLPMLASAAKPVEETIKVDGIERHYLVHDFSGTTPTALVILLHGGGGSGDNMVSQTGFDKVAEREGLITVYPNGSNRLLSGKLLTWNASHCCAYAMEKQVDDVHFIAALIDKLIASRKVDPARVYVTGLSNGGMLTHRLGIALHDKLAAIAPVISSLFGDEPAQEFTLPTLIINGADDKIVKPQGGKIDVTAVFGSLLGKNAADKPALPVVSQSEYWAKVNGCTHYTDQSTADYDLRDYDDCHNASAVQSYLVKHNGHAWPGGTAPRKQAAQPTQAVNANELIWAFFKKHQRQ